MTLIHDSVMDAEETVMQKITSTSVQAQLNYICYIELRVSTYLMSSSGSRLVVKI
jgi:hypothetical protein